MRLGKGGENLSYVFGIFPNTSSLPTPKMGSRIKEYPGFNGIPALLAGTGEPSSFGRPPWPSSGEGSRFGGHRGGASKDGGPRPGLMQVARSYTWTILPIC